MNRRLWWGAALGVLLGVVALWPRPRTDEPMPPLVAELGPAEGPLPVPVDAPPPIAWLHFHVLVGETDGIPELDEVFSQMWSGLHPLHVVRGLGKDRLGVPWLVARAGSRLAPPSPIRRALTLAGLRPAAMSNWLADVWPRAAAAGVIAEERWAHAEWLEDYQAANQAFVAKHGRPPTDQEWSDITPTTRSESVRAAAYRLGASSDPWVEEIASAYALAHAGREDDERLALDVLARSGSPHLQDLAMVRLQWAEIPLTDGTEALLRRVADERPEHAAVLGAYGFEASLVAGDVDRASSFLPMIEEGSRHMRFEWLADGLSAGVDQARGQLAARGRGSAESWRAGLIVLAHRCAEQAPNRATVRGAGVYDAGWRWRLTPEDDFTACFTGTEPPGPPPPEGQRVDLTIRIVPE